MTSDVKIPDPLEVERAEEARASYRQARDLDALPFRAETRINDTIRSVAADRKSDGVYLVLRPDEWDSPHADLAHDGITRAGGKLRGCVTTQEAPPVVPPAPVPTPSSADDHGGGDQVADHVVPPVGVPRRRLRVPHVVRRPGDD